MKVHKAIFPSILLAGLISVVFSSCNSTSDAAALRDQENAKWAQYIKENNITIPADTLSGDDYYYIEHKAGTGDSIRAYDNVVVAYTARLIDGTIFYATGLYEPGILTMSANSSSVVPNGLITIMERKMKYGSKARIIIPSDLAFGRSGVSSSSYFFATVPAYATVIYDIEILRVYRNGDPLE